VFSDVTVGAVGAALITAVVSFVGLVISKEQKVSEFRQAWIDALRNEITVYLTNINAISDAIGVKYKDHSDKVKALGPLYANLNSAHFSIALRLNPDEKKSQRIMQCMQLFEELAHDEEKMRSDEIRPIEKDFIAAAKDLLKYEWKRVKRGETTFTIVKYSAAVTSVLTLLLVAWSYAARLGALEYLQTNFRIFRFW
jgi:hypothetical protein